MPERPMQSKAATVDEYMKSLPEDRREAIETIRAVFKKNLDKGFEEGMGYGMPGYYVPHSIYPAGYHCDPKLPLPFAGFASQKNAISIYLMCLYQDGDITRRFVADWKKTGKKLDMGKSCIRARNLDGFALDVIADVLRQVKLKDYVAHYEASLQENRKNKPVRTAARAKTKSARPKTAAKKSSKRPAAKK
jgi:hypothetical protein